MESPQASLKGKRIFVGLSGGVDSAVSAALLKQSGADVTGVFIKGWYPPGIPCTWADDRRDAMRVAAHLGIAFYTLDASPDYKKGVIDYLLREYAEGRTPNPDIMCNREVKFGAFYEFACKYQADYIATGHYARLKRTPDGLHSQLLRGVDQSKDQSYFLWAVSQEALDHTLFPIGHLEKSAVRRLAEKFKLPVAAKKDSQGICFLGSISVDDFLRSELDPVTGVAVDEKDNLIGRHDGAVLHTLGERVALTDAPPGPWYVIRKDVRENTLTVSRNLLIEPSEQEIKLTETNFFANDADSTKELGACYRYHGSLVSGKLSKDKSSFVLDAPLHEPVATGQSLVMYRGEQCIGGGIIA